MRIEDDGHLNLGRNDLLDQYKDNVPKELKSWNFTREAKIAAWYANQMGHKITFAMPGRLETLNLHWGY